MDCVCMWADAKHLDTQAIPELNILRKNVSFLQPTLCSQLNKDFLKFNLTNSLE